MPTELSLDFETRSVLDLRLVGAPVYAVDESTVVYCMAWAFDDDEPEIWRWFAGDSFPKPVVDHVKAKGPVRAWNAAFERLIWNGALSRQLNLPPLAIEQTYCTMTEAFAMALPGKLETCAAALGLPDQKDAVGGRIMQQLMKPRRARKGENPDAVHWWTPAEAPDKYERVYDYCKQDVRTERGIKRHIRRLSASDQRLYWLDQRINDRGIQVDRRGVKAARRIVREATKGYAADIVRITGGEITSTKQYVKIREWVNARGCPVTGVGKDQVAEYADWPNLHPDVKALFATIKAANKSSTAKLDAYLQRSAVDGRMRHNFQFCGAGSTKRWAARGAQLQNLVRGSKLRFEPADAIALFQKWHIDAGAVDFLIGEPMDVVAGCLRGLLVAAAGKMLGARDYSNIEGRLVAWLAGEVWKVQAFRDFDAGIGHDIYKLAYARSFGVDVVSIGDKSDERQVGKVQELALGFGGGLGAFQKMAAIYGVHLPDERVDEVVKAWREAHPATRKWWRKLMSAALAAVRDSGSTHRAGAVSYHHDGVHLWCKGPSGGRICYPFAKPCTQTNVGRDGGTYETDAFAYWGMDIRNQWVRKVAWHGLVAENVVQFTARDLLCHSLTRLEEEGFPVVGHVHDEAIVENDAIDETRFAAVMSETPAWTKTAPWGALPVATSGWVGFRYRKD